MRGPWSASSMSWIGGDDLGSDGVCGRLSAGASMCAALPLRQRVVTGIDGVSLQRQCRLDRPAPRPCRCLHAATDRPALAERRVVLCVDGEADQQPSPGFKFRVQHVLPARVPRPQDGTRFPEPRRAARRIHGRPWMRNAFGLPRNRPAARHARAYIAESPASSQSDGRAGRGWTDAGWSDTIP
jgi:hypothetical protein